MRRFRFPGGLRTRLALAISAVTLAVLVTVFFAVRQGTSADIKHGLDVDLNEQYREFSAEALPKVHNADQLVTASNQFIASQTYHADSRVYLIEVADRRNVTNEEEVVRRELDREGSEEEGSSEGSGEGDEPSLLDAPVGLATVNTDEAGNLRVLTRPIYVNGARLGTFRVADPLSSVEETQSSLRDVFLLVGAIALLSAIALSIWIASLVTRPLRRMANVSSTVDAGDFSPRIGPVGSGDEITALAESFDHMLNRLEDAFRRQREFVSDASHELRTPLTVLRGQVELLGRNATPEQRKRVDILLREIDRMNRLVNDMLTLAKTEANRLIVEAPLPLDDLVEDIRRDLPMLGDRKYVVDKPPPDCALKADPDLLAQVLRNLVRNSIAHTEPNGKIEIATKRIGDSIEFTVTDDGTGIPPDQIDHIFDRFHRVDESRSRDQGGSGLGLPIAKAIVAAHGGEIWGESVLGRGTTIHFTVPLAAPIWPG